MHVIQPPMLNPISRIAFALAALMLLAGCATWLKIADARDDQVTRLIRRAAFPTCAAMFLLAVGIVGMMFFGPWARPYSTDSVAEAFAPHGDPDRDPRD